MFFYVEKRGVTIPKSVTNVFYLIEDNWDDWFKYETTYNLKYVDLKGKLQDIGFIKIGENNMEGKKPNIPTKFKKLDENFFSLGQSDFYYDNLNKITGNLREEVLKSLNDIAFNLNLFERFKDLDVTVNSLMRDVNVNTIKNQFNRISKGGVRLTDYRFNYIVFNNNKREIESMKLEFNVTPNIEIPTNIHVIIGRNGVGKTRLIKGMIESILFTENDEKGKVEFLNTEYKNLTDIEEDNPFTNIICVAFSAFDDFSSIGNNQNNKKNSVPFINIGLPSRKKEQNSFYDDKLNELSNEFLNSFKRCLREDRLELLNNILENLENDPIFKEADIRELEIIEKEDDFNKISTERFKRLSSGHKIILLTITKLIENVAEKSLVFFDEPEGHLHPPLLSAFIRGLSELLKSRNGVAIIATHSPVVLQEVPRRCVWKLRRAGKESVFERLSIESFGENLGVLTREVFGYEVTNSGFHKILQEAAKKYGNYEVIKKKFNNELGVEAKSILRAILSDLEEKRN